MPVLNKALGPFTAPVAYTPFRLEHWAYTAFVKNSIKQACSKNSPKIIKKMSKEKNNMTLHETSLFDTVRALEKVGIYLKHYTFGIFWDEYNELCADMDRFYIGYLQLYSMERHLATYEMFHCDSFGEYCNETYERSGMRFIHAFISNIDNIRPWCYCSIKHAGFTLETFVNIFDHDCYLLEGHTADCELK